MQKIEQAVSTNALWIDAVCRSHGCSTQFRNAAWLSFDETPPFHPNAETLGGPELSQQHYKVAKELLEAPVAGSFAIKDSYRSLDLRPLGYQVLFDSQWIYKDPDASNEADLNEIKWEHIKTSSTLREWEKVWASGAEPKGIFLPELLHSRDFLFVAARQHGEIVAGCIANMGDDCVGVSNIFLPQEDAHNYRRSCIAHIHANFPGIPLVGYEWGSDQIAMQEIGFEDIGGLRVWHFEPPVSPQ